MSASEIIGQWQSVRKEVQGSSVPFEGQETLSLSRDGSGVAKRKSLLFRKVKLRWDGPDYAGGYRISSTAGDAIYYAHIGSDGLLEADWTGGPGVIATTVFERC